MIGFLLIAVDWQIKEMLDIRPNTTSHPNFS